MRLHGSFPVRISVMARERIAVMGRVCLRCPVSLPEAQNAKSADSGTSACKSLWDRPARVCHVQTADARHAATITPSSGSEDVFLTKESVSATVAVPTGIT